MCSAAAFVWLTHLILIFHDDLPFILRTAVLKNNTMNNLFIHFPPPNLQVSRPMLDKSFHRKVQSRKIFTHRESFETIIAKTEEKLSKVSLISKET